MKPLTAARLLLILIAPAVLIGCRGASPSGPESSAAGSLATTRPDVASAFDAALDATPAPPAGWAGRVHSKDARAEHRVWESPGGNTAFGIIRFRMPLPVGHDLAFTYGFLKQMRINDGRADVVQKGWDPENRSLRFEVIGTQFHVHGRMIVRGTSGWVVYAGTRVGTEVNAAEFDQAVQAREATTVQK